MSSPAPAPSGQVYGLGSSSLQFLNMYGVSSDMSCLDPVAQNYMKAGEIECAYAPGIATAPPPGFNTNGTRSIPLTTTTPITLYSHGAEVINGTSYLFMDTISGVDGDIAPFLSSDNTIIDGEKQLPASNVFFLTKFNCPYRRMGIPSPGGNVPYGDGGLYGMGFTPNEIPDLQINYDDKSEQVPVEHLTQNLYYGDFVQIMVFADEDGKRPTERPTTIIYKGTQRNIKFINPGLGQNQTTGLPGDCTSGSWQTFQILAIRTDPETGHQYSSLSPEDTVYDGSAQRAGGNPENAQVMLGDNILLVAVNGGSIGNSLEYQGLALSFAFNGQGQVMAQSGGLFPNDGYQQIGKTGGQGNTLPTLIQNSKQQFLPDGYPAPLPKENFTNGSRKLISHKDLNEMLRLPKRGNFGKRENFGMSGGLSWWGWLLIVIGILIVLAIGYFAYNFLIGGRMKIALGAAGAVENLLKSKNSSTSFGRFKY
jgi:hypothetical protein